jgi:hypothetical protein
MLQGFWWFALDDIIVQFVLKVLLFTVMLQDLTKKWSDVRQLVPQRDQTLQAELRKQQSILI